ncbi:hypothetical protein [Luteitalea pratensis]|uniref:hypothetical protein n=1 Tax=Luteitalea pratensis TaxID=1855912 RepID=UPI000D7252A3|nr:hypothetical protein [Luteitalea pratensis]
MVLLIVTLLVVGRSLVFVIFEHAQFDADQAITGLMAKHIAELRAFPFYAYASDYVLVVEAWLAAPFLALFGTSVAALRLPLVLLNLVTGVLLVTILGRELYLRPVVALIPALFFVAAPPVLAAELLTATGGNVEPFVYVLLLWLTRERPVAFGIIFLVGFMNREFTAYAASALLLVEALQGRLWQIDNLRQKAVVLGVVAVGWLLTGPLRTGADAMGPGTAGMSNPSASNVSVAVGFLCPSLDLSRMGANLTSLVTTQMGTLLGVAPFRLRDVNINSPTRQGGWGLWPVFCLVIAGAACRLAWLAWRPRRQDAQSEPSRPAPWFALYLALIGLQSGVVWAVSRCGPLNSMTLRYGLLAVLLPVAIVALHLALERSVTWRRLMMLFVICWTAISCRAHGDLLAHYLSHSQPDDYRRLSDELVARGIRYVQADYWTAYMIDFLTDERVIATATDYVRVREYDIAVAGHANEAVLLSRRPCPGGEPIGHRYICK